MRSGRAIAIIATGIVIGASIAAVILTLTASSETPAAPVAAADIETTPTANTDTTDTADVSGGAGEWAETSEAAAVEAAVRLLTDTSAVNADWRDTLAGEVVGDAGDIAAMVEINEFGEELLANSPGLVEQSETTGHRVLSSSPLDVTVEVFVTDVTGATLAIPVRVVWRDQKWKMVAPAGGTNNGKARPINGTGS